MENIVRKNGTETEIHRIGEERTELKACLSASFKCRIVVFAGGLRKFRNSLFKPTEEVNSRHKTLNYKQSNRSLVADSHIVGTHPKARGCSKNFRRDGTGWDYPCGPVSRCATPRRWQCTTAITSCETAWHEKMLHKWTIPTVPIFLTLFDEIWWNLMAYQLSTTLEIP